MKFFGRPLPFDLIAYCTLICAQLLIVWLLPWFPTQDGPSHLYNVSILQDLLQGGKQWGEYFRYELRATPNLGFNLIVYPLLSVVTPLVAERIFLSLYLVLTAVAVPVLIRTFSPRPSGFTKLLAIPVMFNFTLMMGFYSYSIAVPAFLLAIAMAWHLRQRPAYLRFVCCNIAGVIIFFLHLIPFMFYLIALAMFAIAAQENSRAAVRSFITRLISILPLLALLFSYLASGSSSSIPADFSYLLSGKRMAGLFTDLATFSAVYFSPWQLLPASVYLLVIMLLVRSLLKDYYNGKLELDGGQKALLLIAAILLAIYFVAPTGFAGGSYFNDRLPWVILLLLLPLLSNVLIETSTVIRIGTMTALILLLCVNAAVFLQQNREVAAFLEGLGNACSNGDGIMLYKRAHPAWPRVDVILNAPSYYGMHDGCVDLGNYEAGLPYFPVRFDEKLAKLKLHQPIECNPDSIDLSRFPEVKGVLGWKLGLDSRQRLEKLFILRTENSKLTVWRRQ